MQIIADDVLQAKPHIATLQGGLEPVFGEAEHGFSFVLKSTDNLRGPITRSKKARARSCIDARLKWAWPYQRACGCARLRPKHCAQAKQTFAWLAMRARLERLVH